MTILAGVGTQRLLPIPLDLPTPARYWAGGLVVLGSVLGLGIWSVVVFRRAGQDPNPWKPTTVLVERGPFRLTRNPMYLQLVLVCPGVAVLLSNAWILLLTPLCAYVLKRFAILPEEAYLTRKFGDLYLSYKSRVRRWL